MVAHDGARTYITSGDQFMHPGNSLNPPVMHARAHKRPACTSVRHVVVFVLAFSGAATFLCDVHAFGQHARPGTRTPAVPVPDWYVTLPTDNENLLAAGRGRSSSLQVAIDKAVVAARAVLAKSIDRRWEALLQAIGKEGGVVPELKPEPVTLVGSTVRTQKTARRGKVWTAFVLVALPEESARSVMQQRLHRDESWYAGVKNTRAVQACESTPP